jgi:hypothetical protein
MVKPLVCARAGMRGTAAPVLTGAAQTRAHRVTVWVVSSKVNAPSPHQRVAQLFGARVEEFLD